MDDDRRDYSELLQPHLKQLWEKLSGRFYRKYNVYEPMGWFNPNDPTRSIRLEEYLTAVGPLGGPIAITRDVTELRQLTGVAEGRMIHIYSPAGYRMGSVKWTGERIVGMGWTNEEQLLVVQEDGAVTLYSLQGQYDKSFSLGADVRSVGVKSMAMSSGGEVLVVLARNSRIYEVSGWRSRDNPRPKELKGIDDTNSESSQISAIAVWSCRGGTVEVLAAAHNQLWMLSREFVRPVCPSAPPMNITAIAVSADENRVAVFHDGNVTVLSDNGRRIDFKYNTETRITPKRFLWVCSAAVVAYWDESQIQSHEIVVIPENQDDRPLNFTYFGHVVLAPEKDGLRIITTESHEFLEEVPKVLHDTFVPAHTGENALYRARIDFEKKEPEADDLLRTIKESADPNAMSTAIRGLIEAAGHEWDPRISRQLLKGARFGMDFADVSTEDFVVMCKELRILSQVRQSRVGMPLTIGQYREMSLKTLIDRLVNRGIYWLAHEICRHMKLEGTPAHSTVLVHWASTVIQTHPGSDDVVADIIVSKLKHTRGIKFVDIAKAASARRGLAIRLLDQEPRASEQVPMLLSLNEDELALTKALDSGETDLVFLVMTRLRDKMTTGEFNRMIHNSALGSALYQQQCRMSDPEALMEYYHQHDMFGEKAYLQVKQAYQSGSYADFTATLKVAMELYAQDKSDGGFMARATEDQLKLMGFQSKMTAKHGQSFLNLPMGETLFKLIELNDASSADMMKKQFKISDRQYWWIKVKALVKADAYAELERFSKTKSPIGYEPFVVECLNARRALEAAKYIEKLPKDQRVEFYLKAGKFNEAAETAAQLKSSEAFDKITAFGEKHGRRDVLQLVAKYRAAEQ